MGTKFTIWLNGYHVYYMVEWVVGTKYTIWLNGYQVYYMVERVVGTKFTFLRPLSVLVTASAR